MRPALVLCLVIAACRHAAPAPKADAHAVARGRCDAQRAENRRRADASRCTADEECFQAGRYETGACGAWLAGPDAERVLLELREATDDACGGDGPLVVTPACLSAAGACVAGRCTARLAAIAHPPGDVAAMPEDARCVVDALARARAQGALPPGRVALRFPLAADGSPPRWIEAVGRVDPDVAVGAARACAACRWRLRDGGPIPPGAWGAFDVEIGEGW